LPSRERPLLGFGHSRRLAGHEFDPAGRTPGVPAAGVKLIDLGFIHERQYQPLAHGNFERSNTLDRQLGHDVNLLYWGDSVAAVVAGGAENV
jgi:hypothetical protein